MCDLFHEQFAQDETVVHEQFAQGETEINYNVVTISGKGDMF